MKKDGASSGRNGRARSRSVLSIREIILYGLMGGLTFALQVAMSSLPNIEPVSLMVMLFMTVFGQRGLFPVYVYVVLDILYFGFGVWNICYLYIWAVLAAAAYLLRGMKHPIGWALLSGAYGLMFGMLCGIVDIFIGGFSYAAAKWISGIPFDVAHCIGNFVIALTLFTPLRKLLTMLVNRYKSGGS